MMGTQEFKNYILIPIDPPPPFMPPLRKKNEPSKVYDPMLNNYSFFYNNHWF
jgi:hypothetical protein